MHLNLRNIDKLKIRREEIALVDKAAEGCLFFLSVFRGISVYFLGDAGDTVWHAETITRNDAGGIEVIPGGSELRLADLPEFKSACECNGTKRLNNGEGQGDDIVVPIDNGRGDVIGLLLFSGAAGLSARRGEFLAAIERGDFRKRREALSQRLVPDALMFVELDGTIREMNFIASELNQFQDHEYRDVFEYINRNGGKNIDLNQILARGNCFCDFFTLDQCELIAAFLPLYEEDVSPAGFLALISDVSLIGKKDKQLLEKSAVIREIHHRVKNNLQTVSSLLRIQMRRVKSPALERIIFASINRILSIALIHDELSKDGLEKVNLKYTIKGIMEMVLNTMADPQKCIKGEISGKDMILAANVASNLSLCITELVQNAIEHAFVYRNTGNILITVDHDESEAVVVVEDDGIGMLPARQKPNTMGLNVVELIVADNLAGTFSIEGRGAGTKAEIRFPLKGRES